MKHLIDPTVDCVFKAILGSLPNKDLLIDFLNAVLHLSAQNRIEEVELLNPYNEKEFETDKLTIVDIKAKDQKNCIYQIEIQLSLYPSLANRILYSWSDLYQSQLSSGNGFDKLNPVISIWLCPRTLLSDSQSFHHHFQVVDSQNGVCLSDHFSIHILELSKWKKASDKLDTEAMWLYFFKEAKNWERLPEELDTDLMKKAMDMLKTFSDKERDYHLYQTRQNAIRQLNTINKELDDALKAADFERKAKEQERKAKEQERKAKEEALKIAEHERKAREQAEAERDRLLALLNKKTE